MENVNQQETANPSSEMLDSVMELLNGYRELLQHDPEYQAERIKEVDHVLAQYSRFKDYCLSAEAKHDEGERKLRFSIFVSAANLIEKIISHYRD